MSDKSARPSAFRRVRSCARGLARGLPRPERIRLALRKCKRRAAMRLASPMKKLRKPDLRHPGGAAHRGERSLSSSSLEGPVPRTTSGQMAAARLFSSLLAGIAPATPMPLAREKEDKISGKLAVQANLDPAFQPASGRRAGSVAAKEIFSWTFSARTPRRLRLAERNRKETAARRRVGEGAREGGLPWRQRTRFAALAGRPRVAGQARRSALSRLVQPLLVEQDIDDLDPRVPLSDRQAEERGDRRVAELHVERDHRRSVPRRIHAGGERVAQRARS